MAGRWPDIEPEPPARMGGGRAGAGAAPFVALGRAWGTFLIAQTSGPCPLNPGGASHWPGGSASGSGRGFHGTPNEQPRPHHAVRILLTFWPIGQPPQMRSAWTRPRRSVSGGRRAACRLRRAPARQHPQAAGTGPRPPGATWRRSSTSSFDAAAARPQTRHPARPPVRPQPIIDGEPTAAVMSPATDGGNDELEQ